MENLWDIWIKCDQKARPLASILNTKDATDKLMELIIYFISYSETWTEYYGPSLSTLIRKGCVTVQ